jgi:hypothetical protein
LPVVPDVPGVPSAEDLAALPHSELAVRLAKAYRLIAVLTGPLLPAPLPHARSA